MTRTDERNYANFQNLEQAAARKAQGETFYCAACDQDKGNGTFPVPKGFTFHGALDVHIALVHGRNANAQNGTATLERDGLKHSPVDKFFFKSTNKKPINVPEPKNQESKSEEYL